MEHRENKRTKQRKESETITKKEKYQKKTIISKLECYAI